MMDSSADVNPTPSRSIFPLTNPPYVQGNWEQSSISTPHAEFFQTTTTTSSPAPIITSTPHSSLFVVPAASAVTEIPMPTPQLSHNEMAAAVDEASSSSSITQSAAVSVQCQQAGFTVVFDFEHPFDGAIFVRGEYRNEKCALNMKSKPMKRVEFAVINDDCNIKQIKTVSNIGYLS